MRFECKSLVTIFVVFTYSSTPTQAFSRTTVSCSLGVKQLFGLRPVEDSLLATCFAPQCPGIWCLCNAMSVSRCGNSLKFELIVHGTFAVAAMTMLKWVMLEARQQLMDWKDA